MPIGFFLAIEEFGPMQLLSQARAAQQAGFEAFWISHHYHPWNDAQGHSPLVWSVIGALGQVSDLPVTTAVTYPTMRIHPAVVAQTVAYLHFEQQPSPIHLHQGGGGDHG